MATVVALRLSRFELTRLAAENSWEALITAEAFGMITANAVHR